MKSDMIFFCLVCIAAFFIGTYLYRTGGIQTIDESELEKPKLKTNMLFYLKSKGLLIMIASVLAFAMGILSLFV
jgi:hypothetical protein